MSLQSEVSSLHNGQSFSQLRHAHKSVHGSPCVLQRQLSVVQFFFLKPQETRSRMTSGAGFLSIH